MQRRMYTADGRLFSLQRSDPQSDLADSGSIALSPRALSTALPCPNAEQPQALRVFERDRFRTMKIIGLAFVLAVMCPSVPLLAQPTPAVIVERLGPMILGVSIPDYTGRHLAGLVAVDGKTAVWVDGRTGPAYDAIAKEQPVFSLDGKRWAYDACNGPWQGGRHYAVVDGAPGPAYDALFGPAFTKDSRHVYYLGWREGKVAAVVDGVAGTAYEDIKLVPWILNDGRLVYQAKRDGKWLVVTNGQEGPAYDEIRSDVRWAPAEWRMMYAARRGDKWVVVTGDRPGPEYDAILEDSILLGTPPLPDAYIASRRGKSFAVIGGQEQQAYDGAYDLRPGPGGRHLDYIVKAGGKEALVVDGRCTRFFASVNALVRFSEDESRWAFAATDGGKSMAVINGQEGPAYDEIHWSGVYLPAGGRSAYAAKKGNKWVVVVDGKESAEYDEIVPWEKVLTLVFSADGAHYAFAAARDGKQVVVTDGKEGRWFDEIRSARALLLPDHSAPTYTAREGQKWLAVLDGVVWPREGAYDAVELHVPAYGFESGSAVAFAAKQGDKWTVTINGRPGAPYDEADFACGDEKTRQVIYVATRAGKKAVVIDGREGPWFEALPNAPTFVPELGQVVYVGRVGQKVTVVCGDRTLPAHDDVRGVESFSERGKRLAYVASDTGGRSWYVEVDGLAGEVFDWVAGDGVGRALPEFQRDGSLTYLATRQRVLYRVTVPPLP